MKHLKLLQFTIRQKIVLGLLLFSVILGIMAYVSYSYLLAVEEKVVLVEFADDLSNMMLEIRRSEKNFLLYGGQENQEDNARYIEEAKDLLRQAATTASDQLLLVKLSTLFQGLLDYQARSTEVFLAQGLTHDQSEEAASQLRESGKSLVDQAKQIASLERRSILVINKRLRSNLLYSVFFLALLGVLLFFFVTFKILLPLKVIAQTTTRIAKGNFKPLPVWNTNDEIQRLMEAFNRMVSELESRQDQLVQAQKLSSIGTLASGIAHQLNNPLNNISTSCQILMEERDSGDRDFITKMLNNIEGETIRARDIVKGLLEFSRHQQFSLRKAPLAEVVERSLSLVSSQVPAGIRLSADIPPDLILRLDPQRMQEALLNLLLNAIQSIEQPPGTVRLYMEPTFNPDRVVLAVEDTGKGIPESELNRIFDPFFTTKAVGNGTGLGLFIVYGIVKKHGGRITVTSSPGKGATFRMELPLPSAAPGREK